jgi:hypothetical protein
VILFKRGKKKTLCGGSPEYPLQYKKLSASVNQFNRKGVVCFLIKSFCVNRLPMIIIVYSKLKIQTAISNLS